MPRAVCDPYFLDPTPVKREPGDTPPNEETVPMVVLNHIL